jgi:hypothetical protein
MLPVHHGRRRQARQLPRAVDGDRLAESGPEVVPSRRVQRTLGAAPAAQLRDRGSTKPLGVKLGLPGMTDIDEFKMWFSFGRYGLKAFRWLLGRAAAVRFEALLVAFVLLAVRCAVPPRNALGRLALLAGACWLWAVLAARSLHRRYVWLRLSYLPLKK